MNRHTLANAVAWLVLGVVAAVGGGLAALALWALGVLVRGRVI